MLGAGEEFYRAIAMITGGHREAADADALDPGSYSRECAQGVSVAGPIMTSDIAPMLVFLLEAHFSW